MDNSNMIDEHTERQIDPIRWVFLFTTYTLAIILSFAFIIGPPILLIIYKKAWILLLFLLIFLGFWMIRGIFRTLRKMVWKNRHLSTYILERKKVYFEMWEEGEQLPREDNIRFTSIDHVVLSKYVTKNSHPYTKSKAKQQVDQTSVELILYIVYEKNGNNTLLTIPFHKNGINTWLQTFQDDHIPLYIDDLIMAEASDSEKLARFSATEELTPYTFKGHLFPQTLSISNPEQLPKEVIQKTDPTAHDDSVESVLEPIEQPQPKGKLSAKKWSIAALKAYSILIIGIYIFILLAEQRIIADDTILSLFLFFIVSFLYFLFLGPYLRWYHMIRFIIENFIICLIIAMTLADKSSPAEEITSLFLGLSILFIAVVWIPYLIAKKRKQLKP